jgi:hypothetical protein
MNLQGSETEMIAGLANASPNLVWVREQPPDPDLVLDGWRMVVPKRLAAEYAPLP